jgi:hypothetical protein
MLIDKVIAVGTEHHDVIDQVHEPLAGHLRLTWHLPGAPRQFPKRQQQRRFRHDEM